MTKSVLRFATAGDISEVCVANGQSVGQGEVIALLDPRSAQLRLEQAHQTLEKAEIDRVDGCFGGTDNRRREKSPLPRFYHGLARWI